MTGPSPRRLFDRLSLRWKILLPTVGLVAFVVTVLLVVLSLRVSEQTRTLIEADFRQARSTFDQFRSIEARLLIEKALLVSEQPYLKAAVEPGRTGEVTAQKHQTVLENVQFFAGFGGIALAVVTNADGLLMFRTDHPDEFGDDLSGLPWVAAAVRGEDPEATSIWLQEGHVWQVATVPIFVGLEGGILGTLILGSPIGQEAAATLKENTESEVTFLVDHQVVASTLGAEAQVDLSKATFTYADRIAEAVGSGMSTDRIETPLASERHLVTFAAIGTGPAGERVTYAIASSLDRALAPLRRLQVIIVLLGIGAVVLAFGFAFGFSAGVSGPVRRLVEGAHRIEAGNYDFSIPVTSGDEIGTLARAFNEMTAGLRERYQMEKYVSSSTLDMIRRGGTDEESLQGDRKNVTVFFSDIRGFTSFSEDRDPEEVVAMLNMYLSKQARSVTRFGGVVDKYVGDELVAVFEGESMVDDAVLCAVEIQREMHRLKEQLPHGIQVGIGINTGMVVMGPVGSEDRMDFTVLGSNVNLGARLCSTAEPGQILISESSYRLLKVKVRTTPLEAIKVKGISRPVQVYAVG